MKKIFALTFAAAMACATSAFAECATGEHGAISIQNIGGVCTAVIYGDATASEDANKTDAYKTLDKFSATVDSVYYYKGTTTTKAAQSIVLPFSVKSGCKKEGLSFYSVKKIYKNASSKWTVLAPDTIDVAKDGLSANRPYLIEVESGEMFFKLGGEGCHFDINTSASVEDLPYDGESGLTGSWLLKGTYDGVQWNAGNSELGYVYGLASKRIKTADGSKDSVKVGQFVKASAGASITPLRAYLRYVPKKAVGAKMRSLASAVEVPVDGEQDDVIDVVLGRNAEVPAATFPEGECFTEGDGIFEVKMVNGKKTACIDGQSEARLQTLSIPEDVEVDSVVYNRQFPVQHGDGVQVMSTIMLPFNVKVYTELNSPAGVAFYSFQKIFKYWEGQPYWNIQASLLEAGDDLVANTPYLVYHNDQSNNMSHITLTISREPNSDKKSFTMNTTGGGNGSIDILDPDDNTMKNWEMRGTYSLIEWNAGNAELGRVYGFAAKAKDGVSVGQFVKAKAGASIPPMRAYLRYNRTPVASKAAAGVLASIDEELPETIGIQLVDKDGVIQAIGSMNTLTGEIKMDDNVWFDMKGRKMNKKPTVKGTYYNKGQKVIIK